MRKVTTEAVKLFWGGMGSKVIGNTEVRLGQEWVRLYLHGNEIAKRNRQTHELFITMAGWPSVTTRERLNGVLPSLNGVAQRKGLQHFILGNGNEIEINPSLWYKVSMNGIQPTGE